MWRRLFLAGLVFLSAGLSGQAYLVRDIDPRQVPRGSSPGSFTALGSYVYFAATDEVSGSELWRTDGTSGGTERFADLCPGACSSAPSWLYRLGDRIVFVADDGLHGTEFWTSDGTPAGTRLVGDLCPGPCGTALSGAYSQPAVFKELLIFDNASDVTHGVEPWVTDGTAEGTHLLADACPGPCGSFAYFIGQNAEAVLFLVGRTLWRTDGTSAGTRKLRAFGSCCQRSVAVPFQERLWFGANGDGNTAVVSDELWRTDAEAGSVELASDLVPGSGSSEARPLFAFDGALYLAASSTQCMGKPVCVFREDGDVSTPPALSTDVIAPGERPGISLLVDGALYYFADQTLFVKRPGTARIALAAFPGTYEGFALVPFGAGIAFSPYTNSPSGELWTSDGTVAGTRRVVDLGGGTGDYLYGLTPTGFGLVFGANDGSQTEAWASDGTAAGTRRIDVQADIASSNPQLFGTLGDLALLNATDGSTVGGFAGPRLWRSDGTGAGSERLLLGGATSAIHFQDRLYLSAYELPGVSTALYSSDGSTIERVLALPGMPEELAVGSDGAGGRRLYFSVAAHDGQQLWSSDGTPAGTHLVIDVNPEYTEDWGGVPIGHTPYPRQITPLGERVLFVAFGPEALGAELWISDGTAAGTHVVATLSNIEQLQGLGDRAVFVTLNGDVLELWSTDGTVSGTRKLGSLPAAADWYARRLAVRGREAFYLGLATSGEALWRTDGTLEGTYSVAQLDLSGSPTTADGSRDEIIVSGDRLFFVATNARTGRELWTSDGTGPGTRVLDLLAGPRSSRPEHLTRALPGQAVFAAFDDGRGVEPWTSDGSAGGTHLLADVLPGPESSSPASFLAGTTRVYFAATEPATGRELWAADLEAPKVCAANVRTLCLRGGRFAVRVHWRNQHAQGVEGQAHAVSDNGESGRFWFFSPENLELAVKILDGGAVNGKMWVFATALSDVEYWLEVTDVEHDKTRTWHNPAGSRCGIVDTSAFPAATGATSSVGALAATSQDAAAALALWQGRYEITVTWSSKRTGASGVAHAIPLSDVAGGFWFFSPSNLEVVVKLLDGRSVNGHPWFFYGALSDLDLTLKLTDTSTRQVEIVKKRGGQTCGGVVFDLF